MLEHGFVDKIMEHKIRKVLVTIAGVVNMSSNYTPWERVQISRSTERPTSLDYISTIFERYMSLHGDRYFGDDKAIVGGLASIGGRPVTVIGQQKGRSTKENIKQRILECHHQKDTENP